MRSFGKYFDDQRDRIVKAMQNKNTQQNIEWRERYDERNKNKPFWYKIEDSLFTEEDDKRIKEYEKKWE